MNLAHVHLLLNHFPVIGTIIAFGLFVFALIGKSKDLEKASLVVFFGIALLSIPTYLSGNGAQRALRGEAWSDATGFSAGYYVTYKNVGYVSLVANIGHEPDASPTQWAVTPLPNVSQPLVTAHQNAALLAYVFMEITGLVAWFGLWQNRRNSQIGRGTLTLVLLLSIATIGLMSNASNLGGQIRHTEVQDDPRVISTATFVSPKLGINAAAIGHFVSGDYGQRWVWTTCQTLHFMGLTLLMGVVFLVDLRMLGMLRGVSFATLHRLLPWGILGFGLNLVTGMCYFLAAPYQYTGNNMFFWKIALIMLAGANAMYFTIFDEPWAVAAGDDAPLKVKMIAGSAIFLWVGVMFCGLMLPFIGNAF